MSQHRIQLLSARGGLYETFDYRAVSADRRVTFILRHTLFRPLWNQPGYVEVALLAFEQGKAATRCIVEREDLSAGHRKLLARAADWEGLVFSFASGSFFEIGPDRLRGKLHTAEGAAEWHCTLQGRDEGLDLLPADYWYELPWPGHKVALRDCFLKFQGRFTVGDLTVEGELTGANLHYWGNGYPYEYAAAQCSHFEEDPGACFYGVTARLRLGRILKSPYLSLAALKLRGRWHRFNEVTGLMRHRLEALDNYRWRVTFLNRDVGLEVDVDGANPRMLPWAAWHSDHPYGSRGVMKVTPYARAELTLFDRKTHEQLATLSSPLAELKTLLPENLPESAGFQAGP